MTVLRVCAVLMALGLIALGGVYFRAEQTRCAAKTLAIEADIVQQRRELWRLQVSVARLQAPSSIRDRIIRLRPDMIPPDEDEPTELSIMLASIPGTE